MMELNNNIFTPRPQVESWNFDHSNYEEIYNCIVNSRDYYPGFEQWFFKTVLDGHLFGERKFITEYFNGQLAGVAIVKITPEENKLCNLTVRDEFKNRGFGVRLFKKAFESLETEHPFFTVSEDKNREFEKIFKYFNFQLTSNHNGLYQPNKTELFYNENGETQFNS